MHTYIVLVLCTYKCISWTYHFIVKCTMYYVITGLVFYMYNASHLLCSTEHAVPLHTHVCVVWWYCTLLYVNIVICVKH